MNIQIATKLTDYKWMKAAKAFRLFFELPSENASELTAFIEHNITAEISHEDTHVKFTLRPCHVVDVPHRSKKFTVILETMQESQNIIGQLLPLLVGELLQLGMSEQTDTPSEQPAAARGTISEAAIRGLHSVFFKHAKFQGLIAARTGAYIENEQQCKTGFKKLMNVNSCTEVNQEDFEILKKEFEDLINGAKSDC